MQRNNEQVSEFKEKLVAVNRISKTTKGLDINRRKCIIAEEETGQTSREGVFAGGDAVTGAATVILAMQAGRAGAAGIHKYLSEK